MSDFPTRSVSGSKDSYAIGQIIGTGSFSTVRVCCSTHHPQELLAAKISLKDRVNHSRDMWCAKAVMLRELAILKSLSHPLIINLIDHFEDKASFYIILERCEGGELFQKLLQVKRFREQDASELCMQILNVLQYIHSIGIVHRDIKAENFLFTSSGKLKLIDFGMSMHLDHSSYLHEICGSPHYLAPELIGQHYNHSADVWAAGVLTYLLLFGRYPFDGHSHQDIMLLILKSSPDFTHRSVQLSPLALDFLNCLLERNPRKRHTAKEALFHPWLSQVDQGPIEPVSPSPSRLRRLPVVRTITRRLTMPVEDVTPPEPEGRRAFSVGRVSEEQAKELRRIYFEYAKH